MQVFEVRNASTYEVISAAQPLSKFFRILGNKGDLGLQEANYIEKGPRGMRSKP